MFSSLLQREIDVYQLHPNSSYIFEIWATNQLGAGEATRVETHTQNNAAEIGMLIKVD